MATLLQTHTRTKMNGDFRGSDVGQEVTVFGWVQAYRHHGGVMFIDLRDRSGFVQLRCETDRPEVHAVAMTLRPEWVIAARGKAISRGSNINAKIPTGELEIEVHQIEVLSEALTPPFEIKDGVNANEDLRLQYRYLDLRRPELNRNFALRSQITQMTRQYFTGHDFLELETPILTKSTPRGRPRLPGAQPRASRAVLRPAAVAPAVQAAVHDGRHGPLHADLPLLSR
jgi:aspartyl-tRNA synthetase